MSEGNFTIPTYPGVVTMDHVGHGEHHGDHGRRRGIEGKDAVLIAAGDDAGRDVQGAGRDVLSAVAAGNHSDHDALRGLAGVIGDADRDLASAIADADRGGRLLGAIREEGGRNREHDGHGHGRVSDSVHHLGHRFGDGFGELRDSIRYEGGKGRETSMREGDRGRDATYNTTRRILDAVREEGGRGRETTLNVGRRLGDVVREEGDKGREATHHVGRRVVERILEEGDKGRETTLEVGKELLKEQLRSRTDLLLEHKETQLLIERKFCDLEEKAAEYRRSIEKTCREEAVETRVLVAHEHRQSLERELARCQEETMLLKMQLACPPQQQSCRPGNGNGNGN